MISPKGEYFIDIIDSFRWISSVWDSDEDFICPRVLRIDEIVERKFTENPLHAAAKLGESDDNLEIAREILGKNPRFSVELNQDGYSALHLACWSGHLEIVKLLAESNSELCLLKDKFGRTPLHTAALKGRIKTIKYLLGACPEAVMAKSAASETPFHVAITHDQHEAAKFLLQWLQDNPQYAHLVNSRDCAGNTVLHLATSRKMLQILNILLAESLKSKVFMDVNVMNEDGFTALDIFNVLRQSGDTEVEIEKNLRRSGAMRARDVIKETSQANLFPNWPKQSHLKSWRSKLPQIDMKMELRSTVLITATLLATITFRAALSPPGGSASVMDDADNISEFEKQNSYLNGPFVMFNSMAFFTSVAIIMMLVHDLPLKPWLLISLFSLLGAYMCSILAISKREALIVLFLGSPFILLASASNCLALHPMQIKHLPWKSIRNYGILNRRNRKRAAERQLIHE